MFVEAFAWLLLATSVLSERLEPSGLSAKLQGVDYFISPFSSGRVYDGSLHEKRSRGVFGFIPVTVVANSESSSNLEDVFTDWEKKDDVWQRGFLETILAAKDKSMEDSSILRLLGDSDIPSGPYFLDTATGEAHRVYRLYDDFAGAFSQSLLQGPDGQFQPMSAQTASSASLTIGVPSRLYFTRTAEKPLAGVRIGVKDIFSLAGVKGSNGNRAWYGLYPPANETSSAIQNLIDAGAIIVGLQKLSQFANGEKPTADWVDYHAPFNPRGDGYQDTSSSSAGAGSSIASYGWLDVAVGSDTGGSVRGPAGVQGLFGNRPSHGLVGSDGVMPLSPALDTAGLLTRDPVVWDVANAAMYKENYTSFSKSPKYPKTLYTLDFPTDASDPKAKILNKFADSLARFLDTDAEPLDLEGKWNSSGPAEAQGQPISELLNLTYPVFITKDQTRLLRDSFYEDYAAAHDGRVPFVDPAPLARWAWGDEQPESVYDDAVTNKALFMDWFNEKILPSSPDPESCSSGILLHTDNTGFLGDRDVYPDPPSPPFGFTNGQISIFSEAPDSVFPIGEVPVFSNVTNHDELVPVTVDVMAAKGCDGLVARLAKDLVEAGVIKVPKPGSSLKGGEILLRRDDRPILT